MFGSDRPKRLLSRRDLSFDHPRRIPLTSKLISPINSNRHKYEFKQEIPSKKSVEFWFENHSIEERRVVFSFLESLHRTEKKTHGNRSLKNLDEILQSIGDKEEKGKANEVNRRKEIPVEQTKNEDRSRRLLTSTWRVTNPRPESDKRIRWEKNSSSFFHPTKKTIPEYYFIHPQWY